MLTKIEVGGNKLIKSLMNQLETNIIIIVSSWSKYLNQKYGERIY